MQENKEFLKTIGLISESLKNMEGWTRQIARTNVINIVYTPEEVKSLLEECRLLHRLDLEAYDKMNELHNIDGQVITGHENLVNAVGKEAADEIKAKFQAAFEVKQNTSKQYSAFYNKHPLICDLNFYASAKHN